MPKSDARPVLALSGLTALLGAGLSAEAAWLHARALSAAYGAICGAATPHCPACGLSIGLLATSVGLLAAALRPARAAVRSRAR